MTISTTTNKITYTGNGVMKVWPYTFDVAEESDMSLYLTEIATGVITEITSNYSIDLDLKEVTYPSADPETDPILATPISSAYKLTLIREVPYTQEVDLGEQGPFSPVVLEQALDKLTQQTQQLAEQTARAVKIAVSDPTDPQDLLDSINEDVNEAAASAAAAAASAAAAAASASTASSKASEAGGYKDTAVTKASEAAASALAASGSKDAAAISAAAALVSENNAETAETNAETAETNAETAQGLAEDARDDSIAAKDTAVSAKDTAVAAAGTATTQAGLATTAKNDAVSAKNDAVSAKNDAQTAKTNAETAETNAETAEANAEHAQADAEAARDLALGYRNAAEGFKNDASGFATTASTAKDDAVIAKNAAEHAQGDAEAAASTATTKAGEASDSADDAAASLAAAGLPGSIVGAGGKLLKVKDDETAYEFSELSFPAVGAGDAEKIIRVKTDETGYELRTPAQVKSDIGAAAIEIIDYTTIGEIGAVAQINAGRQLTLAVLDAYFGAGTTKAFYPFLHGDLKDDSAGAYDLVDVGTAPSDAEGIFGADYGVSLGGSGNYKQGTLLDDATTTYSGAGKGLVLFWWFKASDGQPAASQFFFEKEHNSTNRLWLELGTTGTLRPRFSTAGGDLLGPTIAVGLPNGATRFHLVTFEINTTYGCTLSFDGKVIFSSDENKTMLLDSTAQDFRIGSLYDDSSRFTGTMAMFGVLNKILTQKNREWLFATSTAIPAALQGTDFSINAKLDVLGAGTKIIPANLDIINISSTEILRKGMQFAPTDKLRITGRI